MDFISVFVVLSASLAVFFSFIIIIFSISLFSGVFQCERCSIRIASIRIPSLLDPTVGRVEELGDAVRHLNSKICSTCWDEDLRGLPLGQQTWFIGSSIEYLKDAPGMLFALIAATVSIAVSLYSFFLTGE